MYKKTYITLIFAFLFSAVQSQNIDIKSEIETGVLLSAKSPAPFWFTARQEGRWGLMDNNQFLTTAQVSLNKTIKNWNFFADIELDYNTDIEKCYFHHGYLKIDWRFLNLTVGRHTFSPIFGREYSGSGSYLYGDNFRPMDRITCGIPEYVKVPFTFDLLEIRGGLTHGRLDDTNAKFTTIQEVNYFHKEILLHEKFVYGRLNLGKINPYFGLNHSVLMGGYDGLGEKIPTDYWNSFFAKKSEKIGGGDALNAAGAHMGLYDFGFYLFFDFADIQLYYQKPFGDGSGMNIANLSNFSSRNRDQIVGLNFNFHKTKWLNNLTVEWLNTKYQSGEGTPDPFINGKFYLKSELLEMDLDKFMNENGIEGKNFTFEDIKKHFNKGLEFGGRDGYMNNGAYSGGWTYYGMIMGSPLNLTREQLIHLNPELGAEKYNRNYIINDRFRALHLGAKGLILENLIWKTMFTYSVNFGSYYNEYPGRYTWERTDNYYFSGGLKQFYSMIGFEWIPKKCSKITIKCDLALDNGKIFNTFGGKFGVVWAL